MVIRAPAESEPQRREPPPHLQGALRAAAAARDRAERIRRVDPTPAPPPRPPVRPSACARPDPPPPADPLDLPSAEPVRFARTFAAARQVHAVIAEEGADLPLHLRLRDEEEAPRRAARWLSRLLGPLSARARATPELSSLPGAQAAVAAGPAPAPRPAAPAPAPARAEAPAAQVFERAALAASSGAEPAPAVGEALRLPPLGRGGLDGDDLLSALTDPPGDGPDWTGRERQRAAGLDAGGGARAGAGARLESLRSPLEQPWLGSPAAPRAADQLAWALRWRPPWSGAADAGLAIAQSARNLPVPYTAAGLPATRLADLLAPPRRRSGAPDRGASATKPGPAEPAAAAALAALRAGSRWLLVSAALAAGFALGIVAYGSSPLSGTRWGQAMLGLDAGRPARGPSADAVPATGGAPAAIVRPPPPAAGDRAESRRATGASDAAAAAPGPAALPDTPPAGRSGADDDPAAGSPASARGPVDFGVAARAPAAPHAAPQGAGADWQPLYAEGHRFQLAGNLVAAADAYRRALALNPAHAAIHYDLGYVLQLQGQAQAAIDHYRRAVALQPDHGYAHYNLGYLLQSLGANAAALEHYAIAAARLPDNAFVYYDWAWSLEMSGDRAGAAALYRKAIALDPENRPGIDARRRLAALGTEARLE